MCENNNPYVVPVCFGYESGFLYIHSAPNSNKSLSISEEEMKEVAVIKIENLTCKKSDKN